MPPIARRSEPHWVYRLFDSTGHLLYVGMTRDPVARFGQWRAKRDYPRNQWFAAVVRIDWRCFPNYALAKVAETTAIRSECPRHNVLHNRVRHLEAIA